LDSAITSIIGDIEINDGYRAHSPLLETLEQNLKRPDSPVIQQHFIETTSSVNDNYHVDAESKLIVAGPVVPQPINDQESSKSDKFIMDNADVSAPNLKPTVNAPLSDRQELMLSQVGSDNGNNAFNKQLFDINELSDESCSGLEDIDALIDDLLDGGQPEFDLDLLADPLSESTNQNCVLDQASCSSKTEVTDQVSNLKDSQGPESIFTKGQAGIDPIAFPTDLKDFGEQPMAESSADLDQLLAYIGDLAPNDDFDHQMEDADEEDIDFDIASGSQTDQKNLDMVPVHLNSMGNQQKTIPQDPQDMQAAQLIDQNFNQDFCHLPQQPLMPTGYTDPSVNQGRFQGYQTVNGFQAVQQNLFNMIQTPGYPNGIQQSILGQNMSMENPFPVGPNNPQSSQAGQTIFSNVEENGNPAIPNNKINSVDNSPKIELSLKEGELQRYLTLTGKYQQRHYHPKTSIPKEFMNSGPLRGTKPKEPSQNELIQQKLKELKARGNVDEMIDFVFGEAQNYVLQKPSRRGRKPKNKAQDRFIPYDKPVSSKSYRKNDSGGSPMFGFDSKQIKGSKDGILNQLHNNVPERPINSPDNAFTNQSYNSFYSQQPIQRQHNNVIINESYNNNIVFQSPINSPFINQSYNNNFFEQPMQGPGNMFGSQSAYHSIASQQPGSYNNTAFQQPMQGPNNIFANQPNHSIEGQQPGSYNNKNNNNLFQQPIQGPANIFGSLQSYQNIVSQQPIRAAKRRLLNDDEDDRMIKMPKL